jgi:hypothetical protein
MLAERDDWKDGNARVAGVEQKKKEGEEKGKGRSEKPKAR